MALTITITTAQNLTITIQPGPYESAVRGILQRAFLMPYDYDQAEIVVPRAKIALIDNTKVRPVVQGELISRDRATLIESQLRQLFPAEFNMAEVGAVSAFIAAQN